jgi:hypothetical protein
MRVESRGCIAEVFTEPLRTEYGDPSLCDASSLDAGGTDAP